MSPLCSLRSAFLLCLVVSFSAHGQQFYNQYYNQWVSQHFSDIPDQGGITNDPDGDGEANVTEFAFGTDPRDPASAGRSVFPVFGSATGTNGIFTVQTLEREGHRPGLQIDLYLSSTLTNWFRPWWERGLTNSDPSDPSGSIRETFTTRLAGTNVWYVRSVASLVDTGAVTATYYVATNGIDTNPGTSNAPFATLAKATGIANPGNLIYVRGGTYSVSSQISISRSGTPSLPIRVRAFPGEQPIFDFSTEPIGSQGIQFSSSSKCWWLYGLEIAHAGHNGIKINGGSSNIVERCVVHESGDTGIHVTGLTGSYNLIVNCDSYRNYDPPIGGNADGFTAKFALGPGNEFHGCRAWNNSDDGWDLWQATNKVIIENCITWSNGYNVFDDPTTNTAFNGNGNGFKLGGDYFFGPHRISHSIAFGNKANGYDQNNNNSGIIVDNNVGWANGGQNFQLNHGTNITPHVVRNNLAFGSLVTTNSIRAGSLQTNNSWQVLSSLANAADVLSVSVPQAYAPRRDDGSLPETPFLRPVPGGRLVNAGVDTGDPFIGSAPDVGAFETPEWK